MFETGIVERTFKRQSPFELDRLNRGVTDDEDPGFRHSQSFFKTWMIASTLKPT
jgi:hypothetical protein